MNLILEHFLAQLQSAHFAAVLLDLLLKSTVVLALAGAVCAAWRGASAATRHMIWFLAVVSVPFLPLFNLVRPVWQRPAWSISTEAAPGNQVSLSLQFAPRLASPANISSKEAPGKPAVVTTPVNGRTLNTHFNGSLITAIGTVWLAGSLICFLRLADDQIRRRLFTGHARCLHDEGWNRLLVSACATLNLSRRVVLLQSPDSVMPMTWGWWRASVLVPAEAAQWREDRRRLVLLHELAHVKRGDYLTQIVAQVVCALYWFNPLVWFVARQMRLERESACDDLVLAGGCRASDYAGQLVEIAASFRPVPPMAAIAMARSSQLAGRVAAIVDASRNRRQRSGAALAILALIAGLAICLGASGPGIVPVTGSSDALRQQQIERLKAFSTEKEKQSETLMKPLYETISPEYQSFFEAAKQGDWITVTNMFESFKQRHPQYGNSKHKPDENLRTSYWNPVLEICLAYDDVLLCEPKYTQMAVDGIVDSIPAGSIYFGGTDTGRGLPTAFCKSHGNAIPFYTLTQNALADQTYLIYLREIYGDWRPLLDENYSIPVSKSIGMSKAALDDEVNKLKTEIAETKGEISKAENEAAQMNSKLSDLRKKLQIQEQNLGYFESFAASALGGEDELDGVMNQLRYEVSVHGSHSSWKPIYTPTVKDSQHCFQDYITDAQIRLANNQRLPGEDVTNDNGRMQVRGQVAVMAINGLLARFIMDRNPGKECYLEESFPIESLNPCLEPHGFIFKLNHQPVAEISGIVVKKDFEYWQPRIDQMIGGWLTARTTVKNVVEFGTKVFQGHDLVGFQGDPLYVQNDFAPRMFSKLRVSIAGLYAWRATHATAAGEPARMAQAADLAFRQAVALCPYLPETTQRYVEFLKQQHRDADATLVQKLADSFNSPATAADATPKRSVFQLRLVSDQPANDTEDMAMSPVVGTSAHVAHLNVKQAVLMDDAGIQSAEATKDSLGHPMINLTFTEKGSQRFAEITRQHLNQRLAIVIDGRLLEAPTIRTEISLGKAEITGVFTEDEVNQLVEKINQSVQR